MNGKFILDTNIVIAFFANDNSIVGNIKKAEEIYLPVIVIGELFYGAYKSKNIKENLETLMDFSENINILQIDFDTALHYGEIKMKLKMKGTPIPENDIWIAALSKQSNLTLISRDKHFEFIDNLKIDNWLL